MVQPAGIEIERGTMNLYDPEYMLIAETATGCIRINSWLGSREEQPSMMDRTPSSQGAAGLLTHPTAALQFCDIKTKQPKKKKRALDLTGTAAREQTKRDEKQNLNTTALLLRPSLSPALSLSLLLIAILTRSCCPLQSS